MTDKSLPKYGQITFYAGPTSAAGAELLFEDESFFFVQKLITDWLSRINALFVFNDCEILKTAGKVFGNVATTLAANLYKSIVHIAG